MYKSINNYGMDLCQPRNLTVRTHPKHNTQKAWAFTSDWQHGFSVHTASTIGSLTHRGFYYMEKMQ